MMAGQFNQSMPPFEPGDTATVSARWKKWKRSFEIFLEVNNIALASRKKSYLLHFAGPQVQDTYFGLRGEDEPAVPNGSDVYKEAMKILDDYFLPMKCLPLERHKFRNLEQGSEESIEKFVLRLREQGNLCEYGDHLDDEIKEQIFEKGASDDLRAKILTKPAMTLAETVELGRSLETIEKHRKNLAAPSGELNKLAISGGSSKRECYRCGRFGHYANDEGCPARKGKCERCGLKGHFKKCCKTKSGNSSKQQNDHRLRQINTDGNRTNVEDSDSSRDEEDEGSIQYLFAAEPDCCEKVTCAVGGIKLDWLVDSGAGVNVIDRRTWEQLKKRSVQVNFQTRDAKKTLKAYGNHTIKVAGMFKAEIATKDKSVMAEVYVVEGEGQCLLGKTTAKQLGILHINTAVWTMDKDEDKIGKVIGIEAKIEIDPSIKPVQQTQCYVPIPLREGTEKEIQRLLQQDVIEPAPRDSAWISRLVVRQKAANPSEVRLCVDMRAANQAIVSQHYPLPTFDNIVPLLNSCKWFSKVDLVKAFHQVPLAKESRHITTFATPTGYYRYKRLMFGLNCASEIFQSIIDRVLSGIPGVKPFIDDILIFANTKEEHDRTLQIVLERLRSSGFTINTKKCTFAQNQVEFMGHVLSEKGISPTDEKVEAIKRFREPRTVEEVRSFLGMVNYLAKFIPNLATLTTPLRKLLRKDAGFHWDQEHAQAFKLIKDVLIDPKNLGYYSPFDQTFLIADASPTGLGAVLIQERDDHKRVICYISKGLSEAEKAYAHNEKEALALVWATERLQMYLRGLEFFLVTDHQPLKVIFGPNHRSCPRIERWALRLQSFRFKIVHVAGKINIADPLSRLAKLDRCSTYDVKGEAMLLAVAELAKPTALSLDDVIKATLEDDELTAVKKALVTNDWGESIKKYVPFKSEMMVVADLVLRGDRLIIPIKLRKKVLKLAHIGHPGIERTKQRLRAKVWWPTMDREAESNVKSCIDCQMVRLPGPPEPMAVRGMPSAPWSDISMDILGPLPSGESLLVIIDLYSRYRIIEVLKQTATIDILNRLRPCIPNSITTDNAANFSSSEMKQFCEYYGIYIRHTTPYWPQGNGEVERQNRSILKQLRTSLH